MIQLLVSSLGIVKFAHAFLGSRCETEQGADGADASSCSRRRVVPSLMLAAG